MTDTTHTSVTALIEQRIRAQAEAEASAAIATFELLVEAAINKLGVFAPMTPFHSLVRDVRTKHIDNLVQRRVDALVNQLVLNDPKGQMVVQLGQTHMVPKSWSGAGFDALNVHEKERIIPQAANATIACSADVSVPPGATLIIECAHALTKEQKNATEAHALSKLPAGCQVLVLDRGLKASASVAAPVMPEGFTPAAKCTAAQDEQDAAQTKQAGHKWGINLVARKGELQDRIRAVVAAEAKAFFEESGVYITSLDVQFVRQRLLNSRECHYVGSVDAGITLG